MAKKYFLSLALSASYLSAVADRFGYWGSAGEAGVVWGNYDKFIEYTAYLNPWASQNIAYFLGTTATIAEIVISLLLILNIKRNWVGLASAGLLSLFALSMIFTGGLKGPLDYSVFTAIAGSLLLVDKKD